MPSHEKEDKSLEKASGAPPTSRDSFPGIRLDPLKLYLKYTEDH